LKKQKIKTKQNLSWQTLNYPNLRDAKKSFMTLTPASSVTEPTLRPPPRKFEKSEKLTNGPFVTTFHSR